MNWPSWSIPFGHWPFPNKRSSWTIRAIPTAGWNNASRKRRIVIMATIGSILHGAYGDYYEQLVCLKHFKRTHPADRLILFFASEHRYQELKVLDLSFADKVHAASALTSVPVDRFLQYQIKDEELQADVLAKL